MSATVKPYKQSECPSCSRIEFVTGALDGDLNKHCTTCRKLRFADAVSEMCDVVDDGPGDGFTPEQYALILVDKLKELHEHFMVQGL